MPRDGTQERFGPRILIARDGSSVACVNGEMLRAVVGFKSGCFRPALVSMYPANVLRILLLGSFLQLNLLVEGRKSLAVVLGVPSQCFKAVGLVFELDH